MRLPKKEKPVKSRHGNYPQQRNTVMDINQFKSKLDDGKFESVDGKTFKLTEPIQYFDLKTKEGQTTTNAKAVGNGLRWGRPSFSYGDDGKIKHFVGIEPAIQQKGTKQKQKKNQRNK